VTTHHPHVEVVALLASAGLVAAKGDHRDGGRLLLQELPQRVTVLLLARGREGLVQEASRASVAGFLQVVVSGVGAACLAGGSCAGLPAQGWRVLQEEMAKAIPASMWASSCCMSNVKHTACAGQQVTRAQQDVGSSCPPTSAAPPAAWLLVVFAPVLAPLKPNTDAQSLRLRTLLGVSAHLELAAAVHRLVSGEQLHGHKALDSLEPILSPAVPLLLRAHHDHDCHVAEFRCACRQHVRVVDARLPYTFEAAPLNAITSSSPAPFNTGG
jgi:hypothetical protein